MFECRINNITIEVATIGMRALGGYVTFAVLYLQRYHALAFQKVVMEDSYEQHQDSINISTDWEILGPFQTGTRGMHTSLGVSK